MADDRAGREREEEDDRESQATSRTNPGQKSTGSRLKERWLMTRKTWRYMTDAGKRLFPEGTSPTRCSDIPKVQEHFQRTCRKSKDFILWPHHGSPSDDESYQVPFGSERDSSRPGTSRSRHSTTNIPIPRDKRRPGSIQPPLVDPYDETDTPSSSSLPCSPTQTTFSQSGFLSPPRERFMFSDLAYSLPPDIYAQLVRCYGNSTLQHVASRLLEEQLMEEDEYEYEEEEGVELLEIDGKRMRSIGAQTDSYLDMCVQTDQDDTAEDMVKVGAETRAETEAAFALSQAEKREAEELERQKNPDQPTPETSPQRTLGAKPKSGLQTQTQTAQPYQKETPVLKKFWGRRESKGTEMVMQQPTAAEKASRGLASEKDREAPPPKGGVAAKLASIEAQKAIARQQKEAAKQKTEKQVPPKHPNPPPPPPQEKSTKPQEKKSLKSVFKLGLKCDVESSDSSSKKNLEKQNADRFKTVNYDKTLRNIKSKWTKEDDERLLQMLAAQGAAAAPPEPPKEVPKKKKRSKGIQVGDALPQFILSAFRVSSPVEIFYATRRRIRRRSSKAESTDMSGSEGSLSIASSMPTSPRYSMTVADEHGTRNLLLSEAETQRLSQMGVTVYKKRTSLDASLESGDSDREGIQVHGLGRDHPSVSSHVYQRSMSAHQVPSVPGLSALHTGRHSSRYSQSMASAAATARGHRASLLQYLLPAVMQRSRPGGSGHSSRLVAKRIWRTRSKSQSRASPATTSTWTPMVSTLAFEFK